MIGNLLRPYEPSAEKDYRIGLSFTSATNNALMRLRDLGVPPPDQVIYKPFTVFYTRGDLSRVGDGVPLIEWTWDVIALQEFSTLQKIIWVADTTTPYKANVYIRSDIRTGVYPSPVIGFRYFVATAWRPIVYGEEGHPVAKSAWSMETVKLTFAGVSAVSLT